MASKATIPPATKATSNQVRRLLSLGCGYVGLLAELSHEEFVELVEQHGGTYNSYTHAAAIPLLVIGDGGLPVTPAGDPLDMAGRTAISESDFLAALGESTRHALYPLAALAELLNVPKARIKAWVKAGLIRPERVSSGIMHFDFRQVSLARTLSDLAAAGVSIAKVRRSLQQLRSRLPHLDEPLQQLAVLEANGPLLVRLEAGEVVDVEGQFQLDFEQQLAEPLQLHGVPQPQTARQWHEQAVEQEQAGLLEEAEHSYRQALCVGGPHPQICFDLASNLVLQGKREQAAERYAQVVEMDPARTDAWNNLGNVLADLEKLDAAIAAFREALRREPSERMSHYNLADTAERAGQWQLAAQHWRAFLDLQPAEMPHTDYARQRLRELA